MKITSWKQLFETKILSRGLDYYEAELVTIRRLEETVIEAAVEGTETYGVEIALRDGQVAEMRCDCPYAADGEYCKHMAAVLFAADGAAVQAGSLAEAFLTSERERHQTAEQALQAAVSAIPEEELRSLLLDAARKHRDIRERIELRGKKELGDAVHKRWKSDLARITRRAADRHGFIDYYRAKNYTAELWEYLFKEIGPLLDNRLVMDAFALTGLVYVEAMEQEMDDSDGGLSLVVDRCLDYFRELIPAPEADRERMLSWFAVQLRRFAGGLGESLWPVLLEGFTDNGSRSAILELLDERIETAGKYALPELIGYRIALMECLGKSAEEIAAFRKAHWELPLIRKQELDRLEAERSWAEALALLRECEKLDAGKPGLLWEYSVRRIGILRQAGPEKAYIQALEDHVFGFSQRDMTYVDELKLAVPEAEWPKLLDRLFRDDHTRGLRRKLQLSEGMLEQMMEELEARTTRFELCQYEKELRKVYPERVRDLMLRVLDGEMRSASDRRGYAEVISSLKRLYGYPEGRKRAAALARTWREAFPRRRAMLEELDWAKL